MNEYAQDGVRLERTGWRCQDISEHHRTWGFDCPCVDLDFLVVEYNCGRAVALVEYKRFNARVQNYRHKTYEALAHLANGHSDGPLPLMVAYYWPDIWAFKVMPLNRTAGEWFGVNETITEREYVTRLYRMRGKVVDAFLASGLRDELPKTAAA